MKNYFSYSLALDRKNGFEEIVDFIGEYSLNNEIQIEYLENDIGVDFKMELKTFDEVLLKTITTLARKNKINMELYIFDNLEELCRIYYFRPKNVEKHIIKKY